MPAKLVYESRAKRWRSLFLALLLLIACAVAAAGWLDAPVIKRAEVGVAAAVLMAFVIPAIVRQLRAPQPTLLLDDEGIEGSFGFVPWSSVADFKLRRRFRGRAVCFSLHGSELQARRPRHTYAPTVADSGEDVLEIPFWGSRSTVADDLRAHLPALALSALDS